MSLISTLVEYRYDNFLREFNIDETKFNNSDTIRIENWSKLKQKITTHNYDISEQISDGLFCYLFIKKLVWKNIINYNLEHYKWEVSMLYNNNRTFSYFGTNCPYLDRSILLNKDRRNVIDNNNKMQNLIINYLILIQIIGTNHLIIDLVTIIKSYMFDVMVII